MEPDLGTPTLGTVAGSVWDLNLLSYLHLNLSCSPAPQNQAMVPAWRVLFFLSFFLRWSLAVSPGWSAMVRSQLTATSDSLVQAIFLPQPPE